MKALFGAIVVAGRGKLGGHVASRNRAGSYFRTKVTPVNPSTPAQSLIRARLAGISQDWRGLTEEQRTAWNSAVEDFQTTDIFGNLRSPSGFNLHQRVNNNLLIIGQTALTVPPVPSDVFSFKSVSLSVDIGLGGWTLTLSPAIPAGTAVKLFATAPQSAGVNFVKSEFRLIDVLDDADTSPVDISTAYEDRFGTPSVGEKIFVRVEPVDNATGINSVGIKADAVVVSTS